MEAVEIASEAGIGKFTIPVNSPIWKISPETITGDEVAGLRELFGSGVDAAGLGWNWPGDYARVTGSTAEWGRNFDFAAIFGVLKDVGYDGEICLEALLGKDLVSDLREGREFLEGTWKQA